ncbi:MAG: ribonuclease III [Aquabacterium sp.]|nr:ribonuclease III [Aquabacterium sp.]
MNKAAPALDGLQQRLGYRFADGSLLSRALTHKSFGADNNERLEFLGDAVLALAVSGMLFGRFDRSDEGALTRVRTHLVRQDMLHRLAVSLQLPDDMRMSEGESRGGGAQRPSILADALEAIIGAVYLDGGFEPARQLVERLYGPVLAQTDLEGWAKDPKTELQEWLQARKQPVPGYRIAATRGRAHDQVFVVECSVPGYKLQEAGEGRSRRAAEQEAARRMLQRLKAAPDKP